VERRQPHPAPARGGVHHPSTYACYLALLAVSAANFYLSFFRLPSQIDLCHPNATAFPLDAAAEDVAEGTGAVCLAGSVLFAGAWLASLPGLLSERTVFLLDAAKYGVGLLTAFSFVASGSVYTFYLASVNDPSCDVGVGLHYIAIAGGAILLLLLNHRNKFLRYLVGLIE